MSLAILSPIALLAIVAIACTAAGVRAHRGTIGAEPREGGGTRFWLRVPAAVVDSEG